MRPGWFDAFQSSVGPPLPRWMQKPWVGDGLVIMIFLLALSLLWLVVKIAAWLADSLMVGAVLLFLFHYYSKADWQRELWRSRVRFAIQAARLFLSRRR